MRAPGQGWGITLHGRPRSVVTTSWGLLCLSVCLLGLSGFNLLPFRLMEKYLCNHTEYGTFNLCCFKPKVTFFITRD